MKRAAVCCAVLSLSIALAETSTLAGISIGADPTFEQRVEAQARIERVYWSHRTWPRENPREKPAFEDAMPRSVLRSKVRDYLSKSNALGALWERPVTGEQLQAEMDRIMAQTKAPGLLRELMIALDDDPGLIAETLVRQTLVDRLIRSWYARDVRFHDDARRHAASQLSELKAHIDFRHLGAAYEETEYRLSGAVARGSANSRVRQVSLDRHEWASHLNALRDLFETGGPLVEPPSVTSLPDLPLGQPTELMERDDAFFTTMILESEPDRVRTVTVHWPKTSFDAWWASERGAHDSDIVPPRREYQRAEIRTVSCEADTWSPMAAAPEARTLHTAVWTGVEMIIWGTYDQGGRYNPATDSWSSTKPGGSRARSGHSAVWTGREMIVWGAASFADPGPGIGGRYDPVRDTWTEVSTVGAPGVRNHHSAVWTGTEMIVWGGTRYLHVELDTGGRYNPETDTWQPLSTSGAPTPRHLHRAVWTGEEMIVWGGERYDPDLFRVRLDTGARYDPATDSWMPTSVTGAPEPRSWHAAVWTGNEMIIWGGYSQIGTPNTGGRYDPTTDTWRPTTTESAPPDGGICSYVWTGEEMIVWGGGRSSHAFTGGRYDPRRDRWVPTTTEGAPRGRSQHTAVWTGEEMIVWGGYNAGNSGGRYDPATDSWLPTSTGPSPAPRDGHSAVWTGVEMIVWGGRYLDAPTGGRYRPATDTWESTSTSFAPEVRAFHTAVWTGSEMIVWGGSNEYPEREYFATGGRYDPATDTWRATPTESAPDARYRHTAVWTGSEMIVWGGKQLRRYDRGGRYSPALDRWTEIRLEDENAGRSNHKAVWTGSELIVWGGRGPIGGLTRTGHRYDPVTESWTPISAPEEFDAREGHVAVWTGNEMIVWGGNRGGYNTHLATGTRYDPLGESWSATSTDGAPGARSNPTAVWTGKEMIVWGGYRPGVATLGGGRYDPRTDSWTATSNVGEPLDREGHTAVWTGSEMIVWGGYSGQRWTRGGRYCPETTNRVPVARAGPDVVSECDSHGGSVLTLDGSESTDADSTPGTNDDIVSFEWFEDLNLPSETFLGDNPSLQLTFPLGTHRISLRVTDHLGETDVDDVLVVVTDTTPPELRATIDPAVLWPPNHRMVSVDARVTAVDLCSTPAVALSTISIYECERDDQQCSSVRDAADVQSAKYGTLDLEFTLRAERNGSGSGRTYAIVYTATDASGNQTSTETTVRVPHDGRTLSEPVAPAGSSKP